MIFETRQLKKVKEDRFNLDPDFNTVISTADRKYKKYLNKTCKNQTKIPLKDAISISPAKQVTAGDLILKSGVNGDLDIFIAKEPSTPRHHSLTKSVAILDKRISKSDVIYFLSQDAVLNYVQCFAVGTIFTTINNETLYKLDIPLSAGIKHEQISNTKIRINQSDFKVLLRNYYQQYVSCIESGEFMMASIVAGAIAETYLYNFLKTVGMPEDSIDKQTLGGLINLTKAFLINSEITDFPINHFAEVQKNRNFAVHPKLAFDRMSSTSKELGIHDFNGFNQIIKYFGL